MCSRENETIDKLIQRSFDKLLEEYKHDGCCDEFLQDQILIPMAFAKGFSIISCGEISLHTQTMFVILKQLLNIDFIVKKYDTYNTIECNTLN